MLDRECSIEGRIVDAKTVPSARVRLVVDLVALGEVDRLPDEGAQARLLGCDIQLRSLHAFECSAAAKLTLLLAEFLR